MTATTRSKTWLIWLGGLLLVGGLVVTVASAVVAVTRLDLPAFINAPTATVPGTLTTELAEGRQGIYLAQPTSGTRGLDPNEVSVTGPGGPVAVSRFSVTETMERGGTEYRGVLTFEVAQAGTYEITVENVAPGEILISPSIVDTFRGLGLPIAIALLGFIVLVVGVVLMIIGLVLRSQQPRPVEGVGQQ